MAFSIIAHIAAQSSDTNTITSDPIDTSGADILFLAVADYAAIGASVISDSKSNLTWGQLFVKIDTAVVSRIRLMATDPNPTVGSGHTFTATVTGGFPALAVLAVSGLKTTVPYTDGSTNAEITASTTAQPGSITPGFDNELLVAPIMFSVPGTTATIDSGFTITDQLTNISGVAFGIALAYLIETLAAAQNPTWTLSVANTVPLGMSAFRAQPSSGKSWLLMRR